MSVASRIGDGWLARAAWYIEHGLDRAEFVQSMVPYQAGEDYRTFNRLWQLGLDAVAAANRLNQEGPGVNAPITGIPGGRPGANGFRYVILAVYSSSSGDPNRIITLQVDSPFQLGYQGLFDQASNAGPGQSASTLGARSGRTLGAEWTLSSISVQSVQRQ